MSDDKGIPPEKWVPEQPPDAADYLDGPSPVRRESRGFINLD